MTASIIGLKVGPSRTSCHLTVASTPVKEAAASKQSQEKPHNWGLAGQAWVTCPAPHSRQALTGQA